MDTQPLYEYIKKNSSAVKFLQKKSNQSFNVNSFKRFGEEYSKSGNAAFSEKVFVKWIWNELKENNKVEITPQKTYPIEIKGGTGRIEKNADLFIETNKIKMILEFKCNIDMIEKDIFKLMLAPKEYKKLLFIWEQYNNELNRFGVDSSYTTILKCAKEQKWIDDYFYFPLWEKDDETRVPDNKIKKEIERFKKYLKVNLK